MAPEPSQAWPLIRHLHLLRADKPQYQAFGAMADKSLAGKLMGYDQAMFGFSPYGPYWRDVRKLTSVEPLSNRQLELLNHVRDSELGNFGTVTNDYESRQCRKALGDLIYLSVIFMVSDAIPFLGWLDTVRGYTAKMKRTVREVNQVLGCWVEEHRWKRFSGSMNEAEQDFNHVMLFVIEDGQFFDHDHDTVIKATCLRVLENVRLSRISGFEEQISIEAISPAQKTNMDVMLMQTFIIGGSDSTVITLTWALSLLMNNPSTLKTAQDELDIKVGKHRQVDESDIKNLVYLQAIIKETLQLYPAAPLSVPCEAMEDCTMAGFHIQAGTRLLVNLWKLHKDPRIWLDPLEFQPEKFLTKHVDLDVRGQNFEFLPFGSGRRVCPGISFALQVVHPTYLRSYIS
ncbi:Cytochrome P450 82C2 [Vitis vinifera]|uniref:Cytochrome P450 82C2 n=1 Tax=Vitis vinifera TaxID=29760 RepID=A0A438FF47_VITVI|nr:Cytochrome P450 82C2 [Vitis vinifera]